MVLDRRDLTGIQWFGVCGDILNIAMQDDFFDGTISFDRVYNVALLCQHLRR